MAKQKLDKDTKKALLGAQKLIAEVAKADGNEAETRKRVEYMFGSLMGYDIFKHVTREYAVPGVGDTVHCDLAIQLDHQESSRPIILVELKRVNIDLAPKHVRQVASYAIDNGCDWALLTNGREWKLYHILFGKPPQTKLIESWNLLNDDHAILAQKFDIIGCKNVRKGGLAKLWEKSNVLTAKNVLKVVLSEESIVLMQRKIKKGTNVLVSPEDIVGAVRHLLNEAALAEMDQIRISLPEKKQRKPKVIAKGGKEKEEPTIEPPQGSD